MPTSDEVARGIDDGRGIGDTGLGVYLDFRDSINRLGEDAIKAMAENKGARQCQDCSVWDSTPRYNKSEHNYLQERKP